MSVRAVARRAGVGMGTLRYHFPSQRALLDAVFSSLYDQALPDEHIRDAAIPSEERLLECCRHFLDPVGMGHRAREVWADIFRTFIVPDASPDHRAGYLELRRHSLGRVQSWLSILVQEGSLCPGDNELRARYLLAVLDGLALQRALPPDATDLGSEFQVMRAAIASLSSVR